MSSLFCGALSRRSFVVGGAALAAASVLAGCSSNGQGSSQGSTGQGGASGKVVVGTLATEDILPFWVAADQGLFDDAGLNVDITTFQSATELIAGVSSGSVNLAMTDPMVSASIFASGTDVRMEWVTLGATAAQGRFGIQTGPDSGVTSLEQLAGVPIGVGSNTILEYVMDALMERAGVPDDQILTQELQKLPVRYQAMVSGDVAAAALPASLLALGEASGCTTLADDTTGDNISQSVMIARADWLDANDAALEALEDVWNKAAQLVNDNPEAYRNLLVKNANLSDEVAQTYEISQYPQCARPTNAMVDPVLAWMRKRGYLEQPLAYDESTGAFTKN